MELNGGLNVKKQILILGGGYGGLLSALSARANLSIEEASITVINRFGTHQIITELHRLAAGNVAEKAVALPLEKLFKGKDIQLKVGTIEHIDLEARKVLVADGTTYNYDALVLALGSETNFFGIPGLQENSFTLKSVNDANRIYKHVEERIREYSKTKNKADATFVIGGGGLTGVELVGELADELPGICRKNGVNFEDVSLYLVEAMPTILPIFSADLIERATASLEKRGVQFLTGLAITEVNGNTVSLKDGRTIETNTLVWTGGVQGNSLVANCGIEVNRGRATVNEFLQSVSHPEVFLAGDCAVVFGPEGRPYPPTAQLAWQMGELVGANIAASFKGGKMDAFAPVFSGTLASLGRKDAIGSIGQNGIELKGAPASIMKKASNARYLSHINGLFALAY
ncbi:NAD(P)/FAD-dependent oxidoreductase [Paenibacillus naphthalenovorans]|uniref:Pyridine nucleotide-disulfide oxidoreductase n=1 Tax=Paenibacillus naphthalenovorans TaxID=162209 RepID=A0A0U2UDP2_9BACL|nr:pyridine nucleotide-disulfide oxidoreductase [Paenibacillus naphthalenovorans]GCL73779.1 NAD(P)/FAD-dependent oxidoreductase [Paenibacillus naphthalenovorans]